MNVDQNGELCLGNVEPPAERSYEAIRGWESVVYKTLFTHTNTDQTLRLDRSAPSIVSDRAHLTFWRKLANQQARRFPVKALHPLSITLEQFLCS